MTRGGAPSQGGRGHCGTDPLSSARWLGEGQEVTALPGRTEPAWTRAEAAAVCVPIECPLGGGVCRRSPWEVGRSRGRSPRHGISAPECRHQRAASLSPRVCQHLDLGLRVSASEKRTPAAHAPGPWYVSQQPELRQRIQIPRGHRRQRTQAEGLAGVGGDRANLSFFRGGTFGSRRSGRVSLGPGSEVEALRKVRRAHREPQVWVQGEAGCPAAVE